MRQSSSNPLGPREPPRGSPWCRKQPANIVAVAILAFVALVGWYPPSVTTTPTTIVIDSIEGDLGRVELPDGRYIDFPIAWLPEGIKEGDHIRVDATHGSVTFTIDRQATDAARKAAQDALDDITDEPPEDFRI